MVLNTFGRFTRVALHLATVICVMLSALSPLAELRLAQAQAAMAAHGPFHAPIDARDAIPAPKAAQQGGQFTPPDEPVYYVFSNNGAGYVARAFHFRDTAGPNWQNISPSNAGQPINIGQINDFILDPVYPDNRAWIAAPTGVWTTGSLVSHDAPTVANSWQNVLTLGQAQAMYNGLKWWSYDSGSGNATPQPMTSGWCAITGFLAVSIDPEVSDRVRVTVGMSYTQGQNQDGQNPTYACPLAAFESFDGGTTWKIDTFHYCYSIVSYIGAGTIADGCGAAGGATYGENGQYYQQTT